MAKVTPLQDTDHILRHVSPARLRRDGEGNVIGVNHQAFELKKDKGEDHLSAAWVEYFRLSQQSDNIVAAITEFKANLEVKPSHRFVLGNVGDIKAACASCGQKVRISHEPVLGFDSHASVRQINTDDKEMLDLLAEEALAELQQPV